MEQAKPLAKPFTSEAAHFSPECGSSAPRKEIKLMKKKDQPLLDPDRNKILAQGNGKDEVVRLCPARHVHVDYGNLSLRFNGAEFIAFATMIAQATNRLIGIQPRQDPLENFRKPGMFSNN
jgi:hypothetical protein